MVRALGQQRHADRGLITGALARGHLLPEGNNVKKMKVAKKKMPAKKKAMKKMPWQKTGDKEMKGY